ncbi:MAG: autotransporter-associated beta strand repeat-containing protein [Variovorax sp.]
MLGAAVSGGSGGNGGNGGANASEPGAGGSGGDGGVGVASPGSLTLDVVAGGVFGGAGGNGGSGGVGGNGGAGGRGVVFEGGGTVTNRGGIFGGTGGAGGSSTLPPPNTAPGAAGAGGVGVVANGVTILNYGAIDGGLSSVGVRATAVRFTGGANTLVLGTDSRIGGAIEVGSTATATIRNEVSSAAPQAVLTGDLILGGNATVNTNLRDLTIVGAISGAGGLAVTQGGTLFLAGTNTYSGGTTVNTFATLAVGTDASLGATVGTLTLDQGILRAYTPLTIARSIQLGQAGGGFQGSMNITGTISGVGRLTKLGSGTLVLSGNNSYAGGTRIGSGGALSVSSDANLGAATGAVTLTGGTLRNTAAIDTARAFEILAQGGTLQTDERLQLSGTVTGDGRLTKTGGGELTLNGPNTYAGGTALTRGRLNVGHDSALGTGVLAMDDDTTLGFNADRLDLDNAIVFTRSRERTFDTGGNNATLSGAISGAGDLGKLGSGTLLLSGANSYTGSTKLLQGTLRAGAANAFSPASAHIVAAGTVLDTAGLPQTVAALDNGGTVSLQSAAPGGTLTVTGGYVGNAGVLRLGTMPASSSLSDRLILSGPARAPAGAPCRSPTSAGSAR